MANVIFKRGLETALPANGSAQDGVLYFTTDTKRLFLGMPEGQRIPIAEGITSVTSVTDLPAASGHEGEFYYASNGNILAYSNGASWLQVNLSSEVSTLSYAATVSNDVGTVQLTLDQTGGNQGQKSAAFVLTASDNVNIAAGTASNELVISADDTTYTLATGTATASNAAAITLTPSTGSVQAFEVIGNNGVTIARNASGNIELAVNVSEVGTISTFTMGTGNTATSTLGFYADIQESSGTHKIGTIDPIIVYGGSANQSEHFAGGTATLAVYTVSEVDNLIANLEKTLDAVHYMGTATDSTGLVDTNGKVHTGDAWKAASDFTLNGSTVKAGSLIIAHPAEGKSEQSDGTIASGDVAYDIISGDSTDTTYSFSGITHGVQLEGSTDGVKGSLQLQTDSTQLVLTDGGSGTTKTVSIGLAAVTTSATTASAITQSSGSTATVAAVTGVTTDSYGRVTGVETTSFTVIDTTLSTSRTFTVSTVSNVATINDSVSDSAGNIATAAYSIGSSGNSVTVTSSGTAINLELVWGSF